MRLFTAIDIPAGIGSNLDSLLDRLRPTAPSGAKGLSWSTVDRLHITTKFIGEWPDERLEEIKRTLSSAGSPGPVEIGVRGLGWFPNPRSPRVLWAGVEGGAALNALAHATEAAVRILGVPAENRVYSPHLTLARIREQVPLDVLKKAVAEIGPADFGLFRAPAFYLYLSRGGRYTKLAEFGLA